PPSLLRNGYSGPNRWIGVKLEGTTSNRAALGATVRVTAAGRTQAQAVLSQASYYSHDDLRLHFGLGSATLADKIEVTWPSGRVET
ncbi:MAG: RNA-binding protein, partial [Acidobacteria bacterium]